MVWVLPLVLLISWFEVTEACTRSLRDPHKVHLCSLMKLGQFFQASLGPVLSMLNRDLQEAPSVGWVWGLEVVHCSGTEALSLESRMEGALHRLQEAESETVEGSPN